ncbi:hypothetical protein BN12_30057 [Nostocoides japonicum T1-X7]|uniref:Uncharacterized protein n=1 Tax=Nostocoides japonicum T1-X7 TaxID=1194083 RepID=A0A077LXV9_9MICO|nr:hypothetical protein BN12_30057 [Tetrasphaera japonica T1-X7]
MHHPATTREPSPEPRTCGASRWSTCTTGSRSCPGCPGLPWQRRDAARRHHPRGAAGRLSQPGPRLRVRRHRRSRRTLRRPGPRLRRPVLGLPGRRPAHRLLRPPRGHVRHHPRAVPARPRRLGRRSTRLHHRHFPVRHPHRRVHPPNLHGRHRRRPRRDPAHHQPGHGLPARSVHRPAPNHRLGPGPHLPRRRRHRQRAGDPVGRPRTVFHPIARGPHRRPHPPGEEALYALVASLLEAADDDLDIAAITDEAITTQDTLLAELFEFRNIGVPVAPTTGAPKPTAPSGPGSLLR